jgi:hypothetical protein
MLKSVTYITLLRAKILENLFSQNFDWPENR